jgi:hypothetical protein
MTMRVRRAEQREAGGHRWAVLAVVSAAQFLIILDPWVVRVGGNGTGLPPPLPAGRRYAELAHRRHGGDRRDR